ncbi:hypothetical protein M431DRAFT_118835 [Trichoderma harzianum CBS 226.95]|uniref:Mid2 domain-containing protein n=1 Tax=Trichoderma harzianum CBS 226.95 TaxID=983964 RepID=A0A2T4A800_TRIHA|nr:hypothetical protein M431DRAFT_118835 [Trichoderma harzianum CBS 226.95]PTB53200.1 hypothetical protein M431DRAFT_118835 [Trichoderma harzianum CBS 226.95]
MFAYMMRILAVFLFFSQVNKCKARDHGNPLPTLAAQLLQRNVTQFDKRAVVQTEMSTCGYENGDPKKIRTANPGFDCRVDTMNGLWGFCPVTVIAATDCGLAGSCVDHGSCSSGCGKTANTKLTTFTCGPKQFCSTALLTFGVDQTYSYIGCGGSPRTDHYLISPTANSGSASDKISSPTTPATTQISTSALSSSSSSTDASVDKASVSITPSIGVGPAKETNGASDSTNSDSSPNNTGAIIGGVIGGIALLCFSGIAAILLLRRNRSYHRQTQTKRAQRDTHESWYHSSPKSKHRRMGGWGPIELQGSQYERTPENAIELPG